MIEPPFSFLPGAKMKNILDPKIFGKDVDMIVFRNNNVKFLFYRDDVPRGIMNEFRTMRIDLPNDKRWSLEISKDS